VFGLNRWAPRGGLALCFFIARGGRSFLIFAPKPRPDGNSLMNQYICSRHKAHEKLLAVLLIILLAALLTAQTNPGSLSALLKTGIQGSRLLEFSLVKSIRC
jgi:hypothetical protein